jgi:hypothetical protein
MGFAAPLWVWLLFISPSHAAFVPLGSEFQVGTYTSYQQSFPALGADPAGNFVVAWDDDFTSPRPGNGQRFSSSGAALGTEFLVSLYPSSAHVEAVAADSASNFVVLFDSFRGVDNDVIAQRFDSLGARVGSEFQVNTATAGSQSGRALAFDTAGNWLAVWNGPDGDAGGTFGQRFDSGGTPLGTEFQVSTITLGNEVFASAATDPTGGFVVVWNRESPSFNTDVFAQRFDSSGARLGSEFQVNLVTADTQAVGLHSVATAPNGDFVVVWNSFAQDGSGFGVMAQRFDSSGARLGAELLVNSYTAGHQAPSGVASDSSGNFFVVWQSNDQDGDAGGVFGQFFDSTGAPSGTEFQVNTYTASHQGDRLRVTAGGGIFVVVWEDYSSYGGYGDVRGRRFGALATCPASPTVGCTASTTPGKGLLKLKDDSDNGKDRLLWKWLKGDATTSAEFGDPTTTATSLLCVYDGSTLEIGAALPAGSNWVALNGDKGFKYKDPAGAQAGITSVLLKAGASGKAKIILKGKGALLPDPTLPFTEPVDVTVQLRNTDTSSCWEATYSTPAIKNETGQFKDKAD